MKKAILIILIFAFVVICQDTDWIENLLNLNYGVADNACHSYLLALIASILILKK